jgi:hypothetical protein
VGFRKWKAKVLLYILNNLFLDASRIVQGRPVASATGQNILSQRPATILLTFGNELHIINNNQNSERDDRRWVLLKRSQIRVGIVKKQIRRVSTFVVQCFIISFTVLSF